MLEGREATRREVLNAAILGSAVLIGGCSGEAGSSSALSVVAAAPKQVVEVATFSLGAAEIEYWRGLVGQTFAVSGAEGPMHADLVAVTALPVVGERPAGLRVQPFILEFDFAAREQATGDALYTLAFGRDPASMMYLQLAGHPNAGTRLTALLN